MAINFTRKKAILTSLAIIFIAAIFAHSNIKPSNERNWSIDQTILPAASVNGDLATITNIRNFSYTSTSTYTPAYYDKTFDISKLRSVDYIVEPFEDIGAHTFLSFGFEDGSYVSISVEIRKEKGELFSPWRGLLRTYELMYVIADERDVVKLRSNYRKDPVYVYPLSISKEEAQKVFIAMLERANTLSENPEFYNTITNNCTTNIIDHLNAVLPNHISWNQSFILPEKSDAYLQDLGLIAQNMSLTEARAKYLINPRAEQFAEEADFSKRIRE